MMGMGMGIITGALGGAGQAGTAALASQQNADQNLYNAETLAKMNADLDVQKQASIAQNNFGFQQKQAQYFSDLADAQAKQEAAARSNLTPSSAPSSAPVAPISAQSGSAAPALAASGITNPGNLRPVGASTGFQSFATPEEGLAAIDKNLQSYGARGVNTISSIINRWAPPSENNTAAYIADVSKRLQVDPNQPLDMTSPIVRQALSTAITLHENGPSKVFGSGAQAPSAPTTSDAAPAPTRFAPNTTNPSSTGQAFWSGPPPSYISRAFALDAAHPGQGLGKALLESAAPDAFGKELLQQGITPNMPQWNAAYAAKQAHDVNIPLQSARGPMIDHNGNVVFAPPVDGVQTTYTGGVATGSHSVPGFGAAVGGIDASKLAATNAQNIAPLDARPVDKEGRPIPVSVATALANGGNAQGAGNSPAQQASITSNADAAKSNATLPQAAYASKQSIAGLENALNILNSVKATGPGTAASAEVWSKLANVIPGIQPGNNSNNYQLLGKFLNNSLATGAAVTGASGSDARFEQFSHGQPNADTLNLPTLRQAIQYTLSQHDATVAGAQFIQNERNQLVLQGAPNPDQRAQQAWSGIYDPKVFEFSRMDPQDRAKFQSAMMQKNPAAAAAFGEKYNLFHANGWVQ